MIIIMAINVPIHHVTNRFEYNQLAHMAPAYLFVLVFALGAVWARGDCGWRTGRSCRLLVTR